MLTAQKSAWFERVFAVYNRNLIKRSFSAVRVENLVELRSRDARVPIILFANHSSWWDGLIAYEISRCAALDFFVMMEEKNLERLSLFRRLGAFSVDRERPRKAVASLKYAAGLLNDDARRALWIFPQGKILPNERRPVFFYGGLSNIIAKIKRVQVVPVAMRYEFLNDYKPEIFVKIGNVDLIESFGNRDAKNSTADFAHRLTANLDWLREDVSAENFSKFERVI